MKRIANPGKLKLNRESLQSLSTPEMGQVNGASVGAAACGVNIVAPIRVGGNIYPGINIGVIVGYEILG